MTWSDGSERQHRKDQNEKSVKDATDVARLDTSARNLVTFALA